MFDTGASMAALRRREPRKEAAEADERLRVRVEAELREQGLPVVLDTASLSRIVALLGAEDERKRERRLEAIRKQLAKLEVRWKPGDTQEL
jgi:hypothetical protein